MRYKEITEAGWMSDTQLGFQDPKKQANKPPIYLTALHYFTGVTDDDALSADIAGIILKKDKKGNWYLPEYSTSGNKFLHNLNRMKELYGDPRTIILQKR